MSLGFGLLSVQVPGGTAPDWPAAYARSLRMAEHAEATGFDSVWLTEHHFVDDGYLPSLLPMCAAIAVRRPASRGETRAQEATARSRRRTGRG